MSTKNTDRWNEFKTAARECTLACLDGAGSIVATFFTAATPALEQCLLPQPHSPYLAGIVAASIHFAALAIITSWRMAQPLITMREAITEEEKSPMLQRLGIKYFSYESPGERLFKNNKKHYVSFGVGVLLPPAAGLATSTIARLVL